MNSRYDRITQLNHTMPPSPPWPEPAHGCHEPASDPLESRRGNAIIVAVCVIGCALIAAVAAVVGIWGA